MQLTLFQHAASRLCFPQASCSTPADRVNGDRQLTSLVLLLVTFGSTSSLASPTQADEPVAAPTSNDKNDTAKQWSRLFDGKSLNGWKLTNFGGEGGVYVEDNTVFLDFGSSMTGITFVPEKANVKLPRQNYELRLESKRVEGTDFFCGLTFPVGDSYCSLIVGGWGGSLVGLSSIDGQDAARNETQLSMPFKRNHWYPIRVRVTPSKIAVWIDEKKVIEQVITGRKLSVRPEVELCKPLGLCTWETQAALRNIEIRKLAPSDSPFGKPSSNE